MACFTMRLLEYGHKAAQRRKAFIVYILCYEDMFTTFIRDSFRTDRHL